MYDGYTKYDAQQAATYDSARESEAHWHAEAAFIASYLARAGATRLIDVPVGTGRLLSAYEAAKAIYGVDISSDMLNIASARVARERLSNVSLCRGSIFALPFEEGAFDVAVCCRLMHLLPSHLLAGALKELRRVTSGEVILQVYIRGSLKQRGVEWLLRLPGRVLRRLRGTNSPAYPWSHIQAFFHSEVEFRAAFAEAGLAVSRCVDLCNYRGHDVRFFVLRVEQ